MLVREIKASCATKATAKEPEHNASSHENLASIACCKGKKDQKTRKLQCSSTNKSCISIFLALSLVGVAFLWLLFSFKLLVAFVYVPLLILLGWLASFWLLGLLFQG